MVPADSPEGKVVDFAIVGGGIAGAYVAWRLANAPRKVLQRFVPKQSGRITIELFEASDRIGGRLHTEKLPGLPLRAELGGMRYTPHQLLVGKLLHPLRLHDDDFRFDLRLLHLRDHRLRPERVTSERCTGCDTPLSIPYRLKAEELVPCGLEKLCVEMVQRAIRAALLDIDIDSPEVEARGRGRILGKLARLRNGTPLEKSILSAKEWNVLKRHGTMRSAPGARLYELGFWNLLQYYLSNEAVLFVHDALGYESIVANWNVAEAIPWFLADFGVDRYLTIPEGMEEIPKRLVAWFRALYPESVHKNCVLGAVEQVDGDGERLLKLSFSAGDRTVERQVRHVVLALPKGALEQIDCDRLTDANSLGHLKQLLESVSAHPLFKLFLGYRKAWWNDPRVLGSSSGKIITDLPIRQAYYWKPDAETGAGMVMGTYSDERYVEFCRPLLRRRGPVYCDDREALDEDEKEVLDLFGVARPILDKLDRQLRELHPELRDFPFPSVALVRDW